MVSVRCNSLRERNALRKFLFDNDIETRPGFTAISSLPMYIKEKINPIANDLSETVINLPSYPTLSPEELSFIVGNINRYYETY
jgi:perosamine synthetase